MFIRRLRPIVLLTLLVLLATAVPTEAQVHVHGSLLGADGQPMPNAHVVVQDGPVDTTIVAATDERGRFSLTLPTTGGYGAYFTGVHHENLEIPLIVAEAGAVELNVRLGTYEYEKTPDSVWVATASSKYEKKGATLMKRNGETFSATLSTEIDTLAYQIIGVRKSRSPRYSYTISGANASRYTFDQSGPFWDSISDYVSVVENTGDATINVELRLDALPSPGQEPSFQSQNSTVERIARIYQETEVIDQRIGKKALSYRSLFNEVSTDERRRALRDSVQQIMRPFTDSLTAPIRERIERENKPLVRHWLTLRYFDALNPSEDDSLLARRALTEVPPTSPIWSYEAWSRVGASNLIARLAREAHAPELATSYMEKVIENHPDADVRRHFLYQAIAMADNTGDKKRKMRYYGQMMGDFDGTYHARQIERMYAPEKDIQRGNPIPDFALPSMRDSSVVYTDESMRGSIYLIDTWAAWCGPCIVEMDEHHEAYETYKDQGFDIVSISLDETREDVTTFREQRWPMPWKHHFAGFSGEGREVVEETFEVVGIPHPILVDEDGQIIATQESLRGEKLLRTLERVFNEE